MAWAPDLQGPGPAADRTAKPSESAEPAGRAGRAADWSAGAARPAGTALRGSRLSEYAEMPRLLVLRRLQSTPRGMHAPPMTFFPLLAAVLAGYYMIIMAVRAVYLRVSPRWL